MLLLLSVSLSVFFTWLALPASLLLAPMVAGIVISASGGSIQIPSLLSGFAQGIIGCLIVRILPDSILGQIGNNWPLFLMGVLSVVGASLLLGWFMSRMRILPGTTLVWGLSPGAATVMTLLSESFGADMQVVAFMQYLRLILVAAIASIMARVFGAGLSHPVHADIWFPSVHAIPFLETLALALSGVVLARRFKISAGALLIPLVVGMLLTRVGWITLELPRWLLAASYALIGWQIGLRFTLPLLRHVFHMLPRIIFCTVTLIAVCAGMGMILVVVAGVDPLTAYLATSPGGADSAAIIAASTKVDIPFVMSMQMARLLTVLALGPLLAQWVARCGGSTEKISSLPKMGPEDTDV